MSQIAAVACTFVRGSIPARKMRTDVWETPGISGVGAQALGLGDADFKLLAVLYSTHLGVDLWAAALYALQGTVVTIVNDWGDVYTGCLLRKVGTVAKTAAVNTGITCRGEIEIEGVVA